jgi:uncharacterized membrane protein YdjX (TVP38/TMEM64 family)
MSMEPERSKQRGTSRARWLIRVLLAAAMVFLGAAALQLLKRSGWIEPALSWMNGLGVWAPVMFIILYVLAAIFFVPASMLTVGAGVLFGFLSGSIYVCIAGMISAAISFLISRHVGRGWITHRVEGHPKFKALDEAVARDGWKIVVLSRVTPGLPFSVSNYAFGLTGISMRAYLLASLAMIPNMCVFVYFGTLIGDVSGLRAGPPIPMWGKVVLASMAMFTLACIARFARRAWLAASRTGAR